MLRLVELSCVAAAGVAIAAAASPSLAQGCNMQSCTWDGGGPASTTSYTPWTTTDEGWLWDTQQRKCTSSYSGPATWCTWSRTKTCHRSCGIGIDITGPSITCGWQYGFEDGPPTCTSGPGGASKCVRQSSCLWTTEVVERAKAQLADRGRDPVAAFTPAGPVIINPRPVTLVYNVSHSTFENLVNTWDNSTVTFDGQVIPYNGAVVLHNYAPGLHLYRVTPNPAMGLPFQSLLFRVNLKQHIRVTHVQSFIDVSPMAIVNLKNESPFDEFVDLKVSPQAIGLVADITPNQIMVPAGGSVDVEVMFFCAPGYVMEAGATYKADVAARSISPDGPVVGIGTALCYEPGRADFDGDGDVDADDSRALFDRVGTTGIENGSPAARFDLDHDGVIGEGDLRILADELAKGAPEALSCLE
jgi:hypothetical protein